MKTVFGVEWPIATSVEVVFIIVLLVMIFLVFVLIKYYEHLKNLKIHDSQLFLFKLKRQGFSNFQIKIVNNMVEILRLPNPIQFVENSSNFDLSAGKFLTFIKNKGESKDSLISICRDMTIIYDKLYYPEIYKKPLSTLSDLEINQLICFSTEEESVFIGKTTGRVEKTISIQLFETSKKLLSLSPGMNLDVYITRLGDAEYNFLSRVLSVNKNIIDLEIPEDFTKDKEFRHPYVDVIVPCSISAEEPDDDSDSINGTIFKFNEYESVVRISEKLNYSKKYNLNFEISDYKYSITSSILANRTVEEQNITYYTFKFDELNETAKQVLKKFITDHL